MDDQCRRCGAKCCRYICLQIDTPEDFEQFEDVRWYLAHRGTSVHVDEGDWYLSVPVVCDELGPGDLCRIYENRPLICRKYSQDGCDFTGGDYGYEQEFHTPDELEAYLRETMGEKAFVKARDKARKKLESKAGRKSKKDSKPKKKRK
jgi:Fe-S-cluster containining protein